MRPRIRILGRRLNKLKLIYYAGKWHFKHYCLSKHSPLSCGIYVTNRCNFSCNFCNLWRNPENHTIAFDKFKDIVNFLARGNCFYLSLSGGEPLLVKDIFKMISFAKSKIPYLHVVSNGFLIDESFARGLKSTKLDEISISLDGLKDTHDTLRNNKGAFKHAIEAIENLKGLAPQISIVINSVICPKNLDELPEVNKLVARYGLKHKFQPINMHPVFDGQNSFSEKQSFTTQDLEKLDRLVVFLKKQENVVNSSYFLSLIPKYYSGQINNRFFKDRCLFGYHHCEFNEKGEVFPCLTGMDWRNGFRTEGKIEDVVHGGEYRKKLRELESCKLCQKNMYICYFEPRITFPLSNFLKYSLVEK